MNTMVPMKRHPSRGRTALAAALIAAVFATGCTLNDETEAPAAQPRSAGYAGRHDAGAAMQPDPRADTGAYRSDRHVADRYAGGGFGGDRAETGRPATGDRLDELMQWERQDAGVRPTRELHTGGMHGPTPSQIPGGQVITTKGLVPLLQTQGVEVHLFDVLGAAQTLPNAIPAEWASAGGSFDDRTQGELARVLEQATRGNTSAPLVFYCQGPQCWMSYNAALRAIALGYRNVLWYRGGIEAWQHAGLPFASRRG